MPSQPQICAWHFMVLNKRGASDPSLTAPCPLSTRSHLLTGVTLREGQHSPFCILQSAQGSHGAPVYSLPWAEVVLTPPPTKGWYRLSLAESGIGSQTCFLSLSQ